VPTLRLDATEPLDALVSKLNDWQPQTLVAYASMARVLAGEQLAGRLHIAPNSVFSASEVLTDETRRRVAEAWGREPFNVYAATETADIASDCERHRLHLFEDLVITEVVDADNRPVPPGVYGEKVLVTVLFSRTQPLIRYEMSDSVQPSDEECPCGRTFRLLAGIQGRREDALWLPTTGGGEKLVQPKVFHQVMETAPVGEWQIIQEPDRLRLLLAGADGGSANGALPEALARALAAHGVRVPPIVVERVPAIPRTAAGKAPLVKSNLPRPAAVAVG
jgi:phenylacetate-coenzyme A ligase PaaK-like adenylate-forming protein